MLYALHWTDKHSPSTYVRKTSDALKKELKHLQFNKLTCCSCHMLKHCWSGWVGTQYELIPLQTVWF